MLDRYGLDPVANVTKVDILCVHKLEKLCRIVDVAVEFVGRRDFVPKRLLLFVHQAFGLESPVEPFQRDLWHSLLHKAVAQQVRALEKSAGPIVRRNYPDCILIFTYGLLDKTHFLIRDGRVIVRFVIGIIGRLRLFQSEFAAKLAQIETSSRDCRLFNLCLGFSRDHRALAGFSFPTLSKLCYLGTLSELAAKLVDRLFREFEISADDIEMNAV